MKIAGQLNLGPSSVKIPVELEVDEAALEELADSFVDLRDAGNSERGTRRPLMKTSPFSILTTCLSCALT